MPTCRDITELATDFMERTLPLRDNLAVRFHLSRCGNCRTYINQLQKTIALLRNRALGEPPEGLAERIASESSAADRFRQQSNQDESGD